MIRLACPVCGARLKAPDELVGSAGRCPVCDAAVDVAESAPGEDPFVAAARRRAEESPGTIALSDDADDMPGEVIHDAAGEKVQDALNAPQRLKRVNHYLICNSREVIASWQEDGKGWMVRVKDGFVKASHNPTQLPSMGAYVLIEIDIGDASGRQRLQGVHGYEIQGHNLPKLAKTDDAILETIERTAELNDRQKTLAKQRIHAKFLPHVWEGLEHLIG